MDKEPTYQAVLVAQDGIKDKELGQKYLAQVDVEVADGKTKRIFVDISNVVARVEARTLPTSGEYWMDASDDWFEKYGEYTG